MSESNLLRTFETTALLLFLLQAVRVLFSVLFGLAYNVVFAETVTLTTMGVVVLFVVLAFLAPLATPHRGARGILLISVLVAALSRIPLTLDRPTIRLWTSLLIIASAGVHTTVILRRCPRTMAVPLTLALAADQFLRAAGDTYDVSLRAGWLPVQAVVSLLTCVMAWMAFSRQWNEEALPPKPTVGIPGGLAIGALLFLETSLLGQPNAVARWTGTDYAIVAPLLMGATLLPLLHPRCWTGLALSLLTFLVGWMTGHELYQSGWLGAMILAQFLLLTASRAVMRSGPAGRPRLSVALGFSFFLILHVLLALAFTYPYTAPFLRDRGDYVLLLAALVFLPAFATPAPESSRLSGVFGGSCWAGALLVTIVTAMLSRPPKVTPCETAVDSFRVGTYNIHYGYDTDWHFNLEQQAQTIENSGADMVMLQEVDAGRITSYGVDDALWLARRLGMQEVFGPALERLSGVALLSRFPVMEADVHSLPSRLEQTVIVRARVHTNYDTSGDRPQLDAYATWLGLEPEERARQLDDALHYIGDAAPAVLGGDFNAGPDSPIYNTIRAAGFSDPFIAGGFDPRPTSPAISPDQRIDFVWIRGLDVRDAQVLDSRASDHRMVVVELALP